MTHLESAQAAFIEAKISLGGHERFELDGTCWCLAQRPAGANICWQIKTSQDHLLPTIETILDAARARKTGLDFLILPSNKPENLAKVLRKDWRMMGPMYLQGMICDLDQTPLADDISGAVVYEQTDWDSDWKGHPLSWWAPKAQKADWWLLHRQLCQEFGLKVFVAEIEGKPASCACLFCHEGLGLITSVLTFEEHRKRGLGVAVMKACMASAKQQGCRSAGLLGHKRSLDFYRRLGFKDEEFYPVLYYSKTKAESQPLFNNESESGEPNPSISPA